MRYASPRAYIQWEKNPRLSVLKMLAWKVRYDENITSPERLWARVAALYPMVTAAIVGESVTLAEVCAQTLAEQGEGRVITPAKLMQRADKTERYDEFNQFVGRVEDAYDALVLARGVTLSDVTPLRHTA
jgi:hypothetical protein